MESVTAFGVSTLAIGQDTTSRSPAYQGETKPDATIPTIPLCLVRPALCPGPSPPI